MAAFDHLEECMGTVFRFHGRTPLDAAATASALVQACAILHEADRIFSLYKPESPLSRLARGETRVADLPPVVSEIWDECERWEKLTDGWFSAFTPEHTFDPSGLVKTWAARAAAENLSAAGVNDFTLNAGGDVWISPEASDPADWKIGISKPVTIALGNPGIVTAVDLAGTAYRAMATSGSAERGEHIWNPKASDRSAPKELVQVSVIARDLVTADVWATAAFAEGERAVKHLDDFNAKNPDDDVQALFIAADGELMASEGFVNLLAGRPQIQHNHELEHEHPNED